jgi:formate dehydrogenase maturation protein FdhE
MPYIYLKPDREPETRCPACGAITVTSNLIAIRDEHGQSETKCSACYRAYAYSEAR